MMMSIKGTKVRCKHITKYCIGMWLNEHIIFVTLGKHGHEKHHHHEDHYGKKGGKKGSHEKGYEKKGH